MTTAKNNTYIKLISLVLALITAASAFSLTSVTFEAASKPQTAYNAVAKAYGKAFPLKKSDVISSKKRLMGVRTADLKSYYAASKTVGGSKSKEEYLVFIAEVKDSSKVKSVKTQITNYVSNEESSMKNYLSPKGKKLFKNAKIRTKGNFVYVVMIDTSANKKAVKALKKTLK